MSKIEINGQLRDLAERDAIDEWTISHGIDIVRAAGWKLLAVGVIIQLIGTILF